MPVYIPVATGKMLKEGEIPEVDAETGRQNLSRKGKAVEVEHFLFDELWNAGDRKMPTGVAIEQPAQETEATADGEEEKKQGEVEEEEKKEAAADDDQDVVEGLGMPVGAAESEEPEITAEEMDARVDEAFRRTCIECFKDAEMPLEPSDFQKAMQEFHLNDGSKIDLKKSSFKKIGKLLECMSDVKNGAGVISYVDVKTKGHKMITKIYTGWEADFVPQFKLKRIKKKAGEDEGKAAQSELGYPQVVIDEVFQLGKHLQSLNAALTEPSKQPYFTAKDARDEVI